MVIICRNTFMGSVIIVAYTSQLKSKHFLVLSIQKRYIKIKIKTEPKEE